MVIFWFRRDLRLEDNIGLYHALKNNTDVLPIFIFDPHILSQLPTDDARVTYIHQSLQNIQVELQKIKKSLAIFHGNPLEVFKQLTSENTISAIYVNHDYEPRAIKRDDTVKSFALQQNIEYHSFKDQVIFEKDEITKDDGTPYVVFTPFSKKWKEKFRKTSLEKFPSEQFLKSITSHNYPFLDLKDIGFTTSEIMVQKYCVSDQLITNYESTRNFPAVAGTSMSSTHLRFGTVSVRKLIKQASQNSNETFWNEFIWREFFMQILWHFPHTTNLSFRPKYDAIQWDNNEVLFEKWCEGNTGYPMIDAGMRELNATGLMHNRVRMVVASFLCKHLLIDWRWGESYFALKLLDYEQSSNVGNWQWAAGSGVDAAPYFRIFNPTEQVKKFDKQLAYIQKWIPELNDFSYPKPIVVHEEARKRCLEVYKTAVQ